MSNKNVDISLNGSIIKSIIVISIPIVFANLLQSAYQLIDAFWVGRLWADAVAAVGLTFPITFLTISLGTGFAIAGSTLIAQYVWAKNQKMVNHVAAQTILSVVVMSIVLWTIWFILAPWILTMMWVQSWVYSWALEFMRIWFVWIIFVFWFAMFQSIMRWLWQVSIPLYIIWATVFLNFFLDPLFIYGFNMWVAWAALATLVTQSLAALTGLYILFNGKYGIKLEKKDFIPDFSYIKKAFFLGLPSSIEMSARAGSLVIMTFLITSFGTLAIASFSAAANILQLIIIPAMWMSMATSVLVGQNIWAKNTQRAEDITKVSSLIGFGLLTFLWIIIYFTAPALISVFVPNDPGVIALWWNILKYIALSFWFIGIQFILNGAFRAAGNMKTTLALTVLSQWAIQFPLAYYLSQHTSLWVTGIWYSFPITYVISALITMAWFKRWTWKNTKITQEEKQQSKVFDETIVEEVIQ